MTEKANSQQTLRNVIIYLKALPIRQLSDIGTVKMEVSAGNIVVAKITPLAKKSLEDTERAVDELCVFVKKIGGDIARLGDERLVVTPPLIKIWKEKENLE
jgi:SepF-like predicted cell division protein (DUF552 family)